jgi:putative endonuclease
MHTVYILFSDAIQQYYIGYTSQDPKERLAKHLANHRGFTARAKDWKIVYTEVFSAKADALQREKQIKNWKSKLRITQLIQQRATE